MGAVFLIFLRGDNIKSMFFTYLNTCMIVCYHTSIQVKDCIKMSSKILTFVNFKGGAGKRGED